MPINRTARTEHGLHFEPSHRIQVNRERLWGFASGRTPSVNPSLTTLLPLIRVGRRDDFVARARAAQDAEAASLHFDIFDPRYVKTRDGRGNDDAFTPEVVAEVAAEVSIPIDVHFMVRPSSKGGVSGFLRYIAEYVNAGASFVSVHWGAFNMEVPGSQLRSALRSIQNEGACVGLAINPDESSQCLRDEKDHFDFPLIMTVIPGDGGRGFEQKGLGNIALLRGVEFEGPIAVDGAITDKTIIDAWKMGARWFVAGSYWFGSGDNLKTPDGMLEAHLTLMSAVEAG